MDVDFFISGWYSYVLFYNDFLTPFFLTEIKNKNN